MGKKGGKAVKEDGHLGVGFHDRWRRGRWGKEANSGKKDGNWGGGVRVLLLGGRKGRIGVKA